MGYLTQEEYERETARPLNVVKKPTTGPSKFPDFLDIVRRQLKKEYQESDLTNQGLRIFTTLDPIAQTKVQNSFRDTVSRLSRANPSRLKNLQGAVHYQRLFCFYTLKFYVSDKHITLYAVLTFD